MAEERAFSWDDEYTEAEEFYDPAGRGLSL